MAVITVQDMVNNMRDYSRVFGGNASICDHCLTYAENTNADLWNDNAAYFEDISNFDSPYCSANKHYTRSDAYVFHMS